MTAALTAVSSDCQPYVTVHATETVSVPDLLDKEAGGEPCACFCALPPPPSPSGVQKVQLSSQLVKLACLLILSHPQTRCGLSLFL